MIKNKTLTRILVLLLALTMVFSTLLMVSCANEKEPDDKEKEDDPKEDPEDPEEKRIELNLPNKNYNGAKFHVLEWSANGVVDVGVNWIPWEEIDVESMDGDTIGKAVYARNASVEEEYGVEIDKEYVSVDGNPSFSSRIRTNNSTGDDEFQLITFRTTGVASIIQEQLLLDMNEYADTIFHFNQPWWVKDSVESFTLGDHLYIASSEMLLRDKGATATVFFNQELVRQNNLGNLYELVEDGEWTLEECIDMCDIVATSLDGNDTLDSDDDIWGVKGGDDPVYYLYNSSGHKFAHIDEDGYMAWDFGDDDTVMIMKDIFDSFMYAEWNTNLKNLTDGVNPFVTGHCLFDFDLVKGVVTSLRNMEDDYGILPMPKYTEEQKDYSSLVWEHHDCVLGIPAAAADTEMCAIIVEALSWEGYYTVYPQFYDTVLMDRSTRDDESKAMLKIIFDTRSYDPGTYWDDATGKATGLHGGDGLLRLTARHTSDIASLWARYQSAVEANVEHVNNWIMDND